MEKDYTIKIFIGGLPGYYQYIVGQDKDQALEHFANIVRDGYRRVNERGQLVHHMPRTIDKVTLTGPGLESSYPDTIITT